MKLFSIALFGFALACADGGTNKEEYMAEGDSGVYDVGESVAPQMIEINETSETPEIAEQKIIKTAQLIFPTEDPEEVYNKIRQLVNSNKGFIQDDNSGKSYNRIFRNMVIRVPTENFQQFVDGVAEGIDYFDQKQISRQDVSEEFVDLEARLKAKRELEKRYLELLSKAANVKEMLEIERELSVIREEIEAKQGRLNYLQDKVSVSTVNIEFYKTTAETGVTQSYGQKMKNAFQGGWNGISVFFIGILYLWPLFLFAIISVIVLRRILKRKNKKHLSNN